MLAHPTWTLGLIALASLLSIGTSALSRHLGLPEQPEPNDIIAIFKLSLVNMAVLFPLELYFFPRWILATDAHTPGEPRNSKETWKQLFEERWGKVFLARILIAAMAGIGFLLCIVPGFLVMLFFGWTPWRVLLHGESISVAVKTAARNMAMLWPQVLMAIATILLIIFAYQELVGRTTAMLEHETGHYVSSILSQFSMVWMNAALLGLYQWMEATIAKIGNGSGQNQ
jgi:hypothetical protein